MMRITLALFRKEWHEHKVEIAVLAIVLCTFTFAATLSSRRDLVADFQATSGLFGLFIAMFMGVAAVTRERIECVQEFVCCLPVPRWCVGFVRMLMTILIGAMPILVNAILVRIAIAGGVAPGNANDLWLATFVTIGGTISLMLWIAAISVDQPNQMRGGAVAFFVLAAWFCISLLLTSPKHRPAWPPWLIDGVLQAGPGGWWQINTVPITRPSIELIVIQLLASAILVSLAAINYGRIVTASRLFSLTTSGGRNGRLIRHRSPAFALCWLQFREIAPLIFCGMLLAAAWSIGQTRIFRADPDSSILISRQMSLVSIAAGLVWANLVAVTVFVPNLQTRIETFWRSRPMNISHWFWSKALIGLVTAVVCLQLPALIAIGVDSTHADAAPGSELTGQLCIVMAHTMAYSVALLAACLIRQMVYAGILSLTATSMVLLLPVLAGPPKSHVDLSFAAIGDLLRFDVAVHQLVEFAMSGFAIADVNDLAFAPFLVLTSSISAASMVIAWFVVSRNTVIGSGASK